MGFKFCAMAGGLIGSALLIACGARSPNPQGNVTSTAESRIFIDPATGEMRAPTAAEVAQSQAAAAAARTAAATPTADAKLKAPVQGQAIGGGIIEYDVRGRGMVEDRVCVQADGSLSSQCPPPAK